MNIIYIYFHIQYYNILDFNWMQLVKLANGYILLIVYWIKTIYKVNLICPHLTNFPLVFDNESVDD